MMSSSVKGAKTFEASIIDEITEELREDAETYVLQKCKSRYKEVVNMGYFKVEKGLEKDSKIPEKDKMTDFQIADEHVWKRERLVVMGAILYPLDNRNHSTMISIVDENGVVLEHKEFLHLLPPMRRRVDPNTGQPPVPKPGEADEQANHLNDKKKISDLITNHKVDLVVVSADCLEAKKLKSMFSELAGGEFVQNDDNDQIQE